ncbi:MAG: hypothetical protein AAF587_34705 [Bacteroidota bacterium]
MILSLSSTKFLAQITDCDPPPGPPGCQGRNCDPQEPSFGSDVNNSVDPNDITGPLGYDSARWVSSEDIYGYTIRFENDPDFATASAANVTIILPIDSNLNMFSLRLGDFGFGSFIFSVPPNTSYYSTRLNVVDSLGVFVDLIAGIDVNRGEAFWRFISIDPATGLPPSDVILGFLEVNDTTIGNGEGFVTYFVQADHDVQTGDSVFAQADIVFDDNDPIITNIWTNVIDAVAPASNVDPLPTQTDSTSIFLSWGGVDDPGGVGVATYDLYASTNGGPFGLVQSDIDTTGYVYVGFSGYTYGFFTLASDHVGNREPMKSQSDTETTIRDEDHLVVKVYLEGAYCLMACPSGIPQGWMNTVMLDSSLLSLEQPYDTMKTYQLGAYAHWGYLGEESVSIFPDPAIVDWMLLSFRTDPGAGSAFDTMAVFLRSDGYLLDLEGDSVLSINLPEGVDSFYVVLEHYNHLIVMSSQKIGVVEGVFSYDFTSSASQAYTIGGSAGLKDLSGTGMGPFAMYAGNGAYDVNINSEDQTLWLNQHLLFNKYLQGNFNLDLNVNPDDQSLWLLNHLLFSAVPRN